MKKTIVHIAVVTTIAKLYGVAFNPWANYSRTRKAKERIDSGIKLAGSLASAGYPAGSLLQEAFHAQP